MEKKLIYNGKPEDFRWAGFGSGSGTNLRECAKVVPPALIFTDKPSATLFQWDELKDVPSIVMNGYKACGSWAKAQEDPGRVAKYLKKSEAYNARILEELQAFEKENGDIHLIVLGGYMRLLLDPLLSAYQDRIINVHPSELPVNIPLLNQNPVKGSERKYVGDNAVLDALVGDDVTETRSSVIMVDGGVDHGEILVQGPEVELWKEFYWGVAAERAECLKKYADAHQSFQKVRSDWPALTTALGYIANGRIALGTEKVHHNEWRQVFVDDKPMPYEGLKLNK